MSFSDASGRFSYWVAPTPHDGFFAQDPLGRFVSSRAFYTRPEGLPDENGVIRVPDQILNPMAQAIGTVVDLDGIPVPGAEVAMTHQLERFAQSVSQFSDSKGQYRLFHVASGTNVKLSAQTETARSSGLLEVLAEQEPLPALELRRYFGPELALVDKRSSLKLIELGGFANEIPRLQSEAVVFLASQAKPGWQLVAQAYLHGKVDAGGVMSFLRKTDFKNVSEGLKLVELVDSAAVRASLLMNMAEHGERTNRSLRLSLLNKVLEELKQAQFKAGEPHPAELAAKASSIALEEDAGLLSDVLYFESLWLCEGSALVMPFDTLCRVAQELAPQRPYAAKYLIEPCFDDWSWLYTVRNSTLMFQSNRPLEVAALIDAEWAVRLAEGLMDNQLKGQRSRRLATVYLIINSWARDTLEMERPF